ncbi:transketolase [Sporanaerobacter acetigenes]|uniref:transketolase n=1 Tax=Sporanaerobacter acetigenes TaxID=165813 RepID=UPI00190E978B|nr:transketolase [Sporanaerobacter acetigenes]
MNNIQYLKKCASIIRKDTFESIVNANSGHLGGSLSLVEILTVMYYSVLNLNDFKDERDRVVLSKGHGVPALYCVLANKGIIDKQLLWTLRNIDSPLQGHPDCRKVKGIDMSSGSLGQGLSVGIGFALGQKLKGQKYKTYVILGDGELNEGQIWEAAMFAATNKINNLVAIIDCNKLQLDGTTEEILDIGDLEGKWKSFGWSAIDCDGHNVEELLKAFDSTKHQDRPTVIIAHTIKGKGISFMENNVEYHGMIPNDQLKSIARSELEKEMEEWGKI